MPTIPFRFPAPQDNSSQLATIAYHVGEFVEHAIDHSIAGSALEAPLLEADTEMAFDTWYRKLLPEGLCGDGSPYHIYLRKGVSDHLCIFLSGGGTGNYCGDKCGGLRKKNRTAHFEKV